MPHHRPYTLTLAPLVLGLLGSATALAQLASDSPARRQTQEACRSDVSKIEQALGFIRRSQGNQAAADLKEKLLSAKLESDILFKDGCCGLARYIRDKKLNR